MDDRRLTGHGSVVDPGQGSESDFIQGDPGSSSADRTWEKPSPYQPSGNDSAPLTTTDSNSTYLGTPRVYRSRYRLATGLIDTRRVGCHNVQQRIVMLEELEGGKAPYPSELIPHIAHPSVQAAIAADRDLLRRLQHGSLKWFNWFTSHLEHRFVNPVLLDIKDGAGGFTLPDLMRLDANSIYWEEAGHAHVADELSYEIGKAMGQSSRSCPRP